MSDAQTPFAATDDGPAADGFFVRLLAGAFWPQVWRSAYYAGTSEIIAPLIVLSMMLHGVLGLYRAVDMGWEVVATADEYDKFWDPIVYENGTVEVLGPRLPQFAEGNSAFLVDPDATIPLESMGSGEWIVIHRHEFIQQKAFGQREIQPMENFRPLIGDGPVRIDSQGIKDLWGEYGVMLQVGVAGLILVFGTLVDLVGVLLYAAIAAAGWRAIRASNEPFGPLFRVALQVSAATIVLGVLLNFAGVGLPGCVGWVVWPLLIGFGTAVVAPKP